MNSYEIAVMADTEQEEAEFACYKKLIKRKARLYQEYEQEQEEQYELV